MMTIVLMIWLGCSNDPKVAQGEDVVPGPGAPGDIDGDGSPSEDDCDDNEPLVYPGSEEIPYDGLDNDCDPQTPDDDLDADGFLKAEDCDDNNPEISPNAAEVAYDGIDNDCDAQTPDDDLDEDGFQKAEDCNDNDPSIHPNASELVCDEIDNDCDGNVDEDWNGDNFEPNNGPLNAYEADELESNEVLDFTGYIQSPSDIDSFAFYVNDGWGWGFGFKIELETPSTQDLAFDLVKINGQGTGYDTIAQANDGGMGENESHDQDGGFGSDSGTYVVSVYSISGASCARYYTLTITED